MKNLLLQKRIAIFCLLFVLLGNSTKGQNGITNKKSFFAIKTDLVFLSMNAFGKINTAGFTLEKGFSERHSVQLTLAYSKEIKSSGEIWRIIPEYKFFLNKENEFSGFYTGLYLKYSKQNYNYGYLSIDGSFKYGRTSSKGQGGGVTFGYQTYFKKHLVLDFLVGLGGIYVSNEVLTPPDPSIFFSTNSTTKPYSQVDVRFCINLGYKF